MNRQLRQFYIIGHNPNTIEEAKGFLEEGANALEPDIVFSEGTFYVSHDQEKSYDGIPTLADYLKDLKKLLQSNSYNLAMLIFDMKHPEMDPNELIAVVKENFSGGICEGVAMLLTHGDDVDLVNKYKGKYPNVGIGVDESNIPPAELEEIFKKAGQKNYAYADGIITFLTKLGVYENVTAALQTRYKNEPDSFTLIYTWVLSLEASMRKYLNAHVDGIFVDVSSVDRLKKLITNPPYDKYYQLAMNGHNPFTAEQIPKYCLTVKTMDKHLAGTDAEILFTLTNNTGVSLQSLPFKADLKGALESNSLTCVILEGIELGEIKSITVEALTSDINSDWLPEYIIVESKLLDKDYKFVFNGDNLPEEWITKKSGPVTKFLNAD